MLVAVQLSVSGVYRPPVSKEVLAPSHPAPNNHLAATPDCGMT